MIDTISVVLFGLLFAATAGAAFAFMWKSMSMVREEYNKPPRPKTRIPAPHPEMEGVKWGEELMVVNFEDEDDDDDGGDVVRVD
tara:strand:- start:141 stop:392 length:252 start_codon:yes stop_codon:yes gene_type:complete